MKFLTAILAALVPLGGSAQVIADGRGAGIFAVADFGAAGDGKADDAPAVRKALAAAIQAGPGSKVVFERKTYRFDRQPGGAVLALEDADGITLEGNRAEIIGSPWNGFLSIRNSRHIAMRGFVIDFDPAGFTQGDIVEVGPEKGGFLLRIHPGYANPVELGETLDKKAWDRVGFTIDAKERRLKPGPIDFIKDITEVDRARRLLRITLQAETFSHIAVGDRFVMGLHHGGSGALIEVCQSADILLEDYTIHSGKFGMNHVLSDNDGRVHVKGARIAFRPGSNHLVTSIKDGFHVKHNRIGPIIEGCVLEGMMDDAINISVCPYWVRQDMGGNRYLIAELQFSPRAGDRLMAYTPVPGRVTMPLKVLAVEPAQTPKGMSGKWNIITLDQPIPDLSPHGGGNLFPGGDDKLRITGLYNLDRCGRGYIVRNNTFLAQRRHALLARGPDGLFEGNMVDGVGGSGVWLGNEIGSFYEGPFPENTIIRNNTFRNTVGTPIHVTANGTDAWVRNISIEDNTFSGWPGNAIRLSKLRGGLIRGNQIEAGRGGVSAAVPVRVKDAADLRIQNNTVIDHTGRVASAFHLAEGVDAASLIMTSNRIEVDSGFPKLMSIVPPLFIQPRGNGMLPMRANDDSGAVFQVGPGQPPGRKSGPVWSLHPPWKNNLKGALVFEAPADLAGARGIRFATRSTTGRGDGVTLTVEWKPANAPDTGYRTCYEGLIRGLEWRSQHAKLDTQADKLLLRFRFDCGPAGDTDSDSVQIANLDVFTDLQGILRVRDFGAVGDGATDDAPAIGKAFEAARNAGIPSTVVFEKKTYRLGDNPAAWHRFQMDGHEYLTIDGNGATLLCGEGSLAFHFDGGRDITLRGLTFDTVKPAFTQGEVIAVDAAGSMDVRIMDGYPEPPDEAFLTANKRATHGGGGRHMIVFEQGGGRRNTRLGNDHLYIRNITRVSPGVFRFHVKENYVATMQGVAAGNWISFGFNKVHLPAAEVTAKDRSASTYGQIAADRVENITFENINFLGSMNGGIRVSDMPGDVTLREVRIIRKPGTRHLLSTVSDALHLMNIRGRLLLENCEVEAPGDDCLNVGTLMEQIVDVSKEDPKTMSLRTTDNRYYHYTIRKGDRLQFLDTVAKRDLGVATVNRAEFDMRSRIHRITLDRELPEFQVDGMRVLNLDQMTASTVIRNNRMTPYMRNAMLVRAHNMAIEGNRLDGTHGGVIGLNFTYSMGESARLRNIRVADNAIDSFAGAAIVAFNAHKDGGGELDARDLVISGNHIRFGTPRAIRITGFNGLVMRDNRFVRNGEPVADPADSIAVDNCPGWRMMP